MAKRKAGSAWRSLVVAGAAISAVVGLILAAQLGLLPPLFGPEQAALQRAVFWGCLLFGALLIVVALGMVTRRAVDLLGTGRRLDKAQLKIWRLERQADSAAMRRAREILSYGPQGKDSNGAV